MIGKPAQQPTPNENRHQALPRAITTGEPRSLQATPTRCSASANAPWVQTNVAGVINATTPLWTVLVAFLAGTDRTVNWRRGAGLMLGFAGTVLIFTPWESANEITSWGGVAILAASASYGISYVNMGKFLTNKGIQPIMLSASQLATFDRRHSTGLRAANPGESRDRF